MSERPGFTRREFVQGSLALFSTISSTPLFLQNSAFAISNQHNQSAVKSRPGVPDERILVVVQLSGGNDGLNTVIPYGESIYYKQRSRIAIAEKKVLKLDTKQGIGLHPSLAPIMDMIQDQRAAIIQGVGYPNPNRSHFTSMDIWHTGDTRGGHGVGWLGKAVDEMQRTTHRPLEATTAIAIGKKAPLAMNGKISKPVAFENLNLFKWTGAQLHPSLGERYAQINRAGILPNAGNEAAGSQKAFVMRTALNAQIATDQILKASQNKTETNFPASNLGNQLQKVAKMIRAQMPTRIYYVALGGFDTHANQTGGHARTLEQFAKAIDAFYKELSAIGQSSRVLTVAFSEFGRRVAQNASNGTDHGTAGPLFLFGDMVNTGLQGKMPSLRKLDQGDLIYNVDFRPIYANILEQWMALDSRRVLGMPFKPMNLFQKSIYRRRA